MKYLTIVFMLASFLGCKSQSSVPVATDSIAEKMLLYQRLNGGWAQYKGDATNYKLPISETLKVKLLADKGALDATIDDGSTTREINYFLEEAYPLTKNEAYLKAAEQGIAYLLEAQNAAGGWPQYYPKTNSYHKHITYNDNAMIDVMWIIKHLAENSDTFKPVKSSLKAEAKIALEKGIDCILKTQVRQNGKLTVWCAQHDSETLLPAQARAFEPPSLSGSESVGIVRFLMGIDQPSQEIKEAVMAAVAWLEKVKIEDMDVEIRKDPSQPTGKDRVIFAKEGSNLWARFYELETDRPIFSGRDGVIKYSLPEVENERRVGYGFYGNWGQKLLEKEYPKWLEKWGKK